MAQYGYSAGYQGGGPSAVPSGFIEAYSQAGRNIGAGMQQIGNAIGESLARYGQNKAENEFLQTRLESLAPYLNTVAQSGNIMDKNSAESKLLGDIEKFSSMSIPQKKATLLNAEFFLDRADKAKAREMQDLQATAARFNLETAQEAEARRRATEQAISQVAQLPTQQEMTVPAAPAFITSSLNIPAEQQPYTPFYQVQQIPGAAMQQPPPAVASYAQGLGRPAPTIPQRIPVGDQALFPQRMAAQPMPVAPVTQRIPVRDQPMIQRTAALPAGIARIPQQETPLFESQPIPRATTETQAVPYQDRFRQAIDVFQRFNVPINPEAIRGVLEATGTPQPTTVEQVRDLGSVVRFGGKEQFVPRKDTNIDDMLKIRGLTIDFPEFKGTAPSAKEAETFREQYYNLLTSRRDLGRLIEIANMGAGTQQTPQIKAEADQLARTVQGAMRLDILGPGTVTDSDRKMLESIVRNPTDIFSLSSSNKKALEGLLSRATNGITTRAQSLGLQVSTPQAGQSRSSLASDPRVASIRARMNSGAITRQQAAQELQSLK
ncbi:hypothetical protein UFOVP175_37 [uncultured Caudovirales phage]|uniref:Uncharacterized protein n=1 Tax=uncultured Caudovirales phage TaxID=2100421 RepID=A0A6J7WC70_9CAUD|nr:hypothetical protein UFOVP175_37 [uncultured Caudovirales phage]